MEKKKPIQLCKWHCLRRAEELREKWYFVTKIVLTYCEKKNCSCDGENVLKFKAEGREFAKFLGSLEQFIQTIFGNSAFLTCFWRFLISRKIRIQIGKKYLDLETCRKS